MTDLKTFPAESEEALQIKKQAFRLVQSKLRIGPERLLIAVALVSFLISKPFQEIFVSIFDVPIFALLYYKRKWIGQTERLLRGETLVPLAQVSDEAELVFEEVKANSGIPELSVLVEIGGLKPQVKYRPAMKKNIITISKRILEILDPSEFKFFLFYALARKECDLKHSQLGVRAGLVIGMLVFVISLVGFYFLRSEYPFPTYLRLSGICSAMIGFIFWLVRTAFSEGEVNFKCDSQALKSTLDFLSAETAIRKITLNTNIVEPKNMNIGHSNEHNRIENLRIQARELDIPAESNYGNSAKVLVSYD